MRTTRARESRLMKNITDEHRHRLGWIAEAAGRNGLALLEVNEAGTGKPAVLLVAVDQDETGKGSRMAPLARLDVNFVKDFTPPEGVEQVTGEEDEGVDITGVGC